MSNIQFLMKFNNVIKLLHQIVKNDKKNKWKKNKQQTNKSKATTQLHVIKFWKPQ